MKINEIRREVCKKANELIKSGCWKKSWAFKWAWERVKKELNQIKVTDLKAGDKIRIEYGDDGNFATLTVKSISVPTEPWLKGYLRVSADNYGREIEFCTEIDSRLDKAA